MFILLFFSFLAGFVTILAPCIWPLLPIVLSASTGTGKKRPLGITLGVMTSFTIFTLSISYLEQLFHIDANIFRTMAVIIILLLGISMLFPSIGAHLESWINRLLHPLQKYGQKKGEGFGSGFSTGISIGLVWAPCAGPILATVATLAATQAVNIKVVFVTLAYVCGLGIPLFFFSLAGSAWFSRMRKLTRFTGIIQQVFGVVMIVAALLIYTNYDKIIQIKILNAFPSYGKIFDSIEKNQQLTAELNTLRGNPQSSTHEIQGDSLPDLGSANEITGIAAWLNVDAPLSLSKLKGKVVLIDFWTYSCINCVRTLPHVTGWYEKYKNHNFVVIGVHTPEFAFEKNVTNVGNALRQFAIHYPVALDNNYGTWRAYKNQYWPAEYLIDAKGRLRRTHFGEGKYEEMELAIRQLLQEAGEVLDVPVQPLADTTPRFSRTPETYLGKARLERCVSNERIEGGEQYFTAPAAIPDDHFAYEGTWTITAESAKAKQGSQLEFQFTASKVYLVISPHTKGDQVKVWLDGKEVDEANAGDDVNGGVIVLDEERLYHLLDLKGPPAGHRLRLEFQQDNIAVYAFTFG